MNNQTEENYLKAIFKLSESADGPVSTSAIAAQIGVQAATVTDMLKKLCTKNKIHYKRYYGVELSELGRIEAVRIIRKHRLWETFLVQKLGFNWSEVHEVADQLEHVQSFELMDRLDAFLNFPKVDPHGDPIPGKNGEIHFRPGTLLADLKVGQQGCISAVCQDAKDLLNYLEKHNLRINNSVKVLGISSFDGSVKLSIEGKEHAVSEKIARNILVDLA